MARATQGWRACAHTPSRVAPSVGHHQLQEGSSNYSHECAIPLQVGAMGTFTSGEFYEVEARVEGGERYFDNGTCRVGTMAWSLPFAADALVGKRGVTVGLALLGNAAIVESVRSRQFSCSCAVCNCGGV